MTQQDKDLMNNRVYTAQNGDMYGEAYRRNIKMASPITGKIEEVPSGYHRMFTRKPQIHYHSIVYKDKVEIEEPLTKKRKISPKINKIFDVICIFLTQTNFNF